MTMVDERVQSETPRATGRGLTVVIPSKNADNLGPCMAALRKNEPEARRLVIDDGVDQVRLVKRHGWSLGNEGAGWIRGIRPFVFAQNCNLGIAHAGENDVVLLNDDAILESPGGFTRMQTFAAEHGDVGLVSATTNHAGNPAQHRQRGVGVRLLSGNTAGNSFPTVAFVCVLIPRRTINCIGLLDERFTAYGFEDNDYCRRIRNAGFRIAIHDGCYVNHSKLESSYRGKPAAGGKLIDGLAIYLAKWGSM